MKLNVFKSKIHRATVTHADLSYEGSVTVDAKNRILAEAGPELPGPLLDSIGLGS